MFVHTYRFVAADMAGNEKELGFLQARNDREALGKAHIRARSLHLDPYTLMGVWDKDSRFWKETLTIADLDIDFDN